MSLPTCSQNKEADSLQSYSATQLLPNLLLEVMISLETGLVLWCWALFAGCGGQEAVKQGKWVPVLLSCWLGPVLHGDLFILGTFQHFKITLLVKECCKSFCFLSPPQVPHADSAFSCKTC